MRGRVSHTALASRRATRLTRGLLRRACRAAVTRSGHADVGPQATLRRFAGVNNMPPAQRVALAERAE